MRSHIASDAVSSESSSNWSLKNIIFGAPIKDQGFASRGRGKAGAKTDKPIAHGGGIRGINYNLFALAQRLQISGTPTFVMGDQMVRGYVPLNEMQAVVAEERG